MKKFKVWRRSLAETFHFSLTPSIVIVIIVLELSSASFDAVIFAESDNKSDVYNKFECPRSNNGAEPARIRVFLHIESIREITSEAKLDFYLVQNWNDSRLGHFQHQVRVFYKDKIK